MGSSVFLSNLRVVGVPGQASVLNVSNRHDAQECFCGEPNCVGYIGGKTQTDIGGMDDLYIEGKEWEC